MIKEDEMLTSLDIDGILEASIDDLVKVLKVNKTPFIGYDRQQNIAIAKVCEAMFRIGFIKGFKRGKSVGSHQAYDYFILKDHYTDVIELGWDDYCPLCGSLIGYEED